MGNLTIFNKSNSNSIASAGSNDNRHEISEEEIIKGYFSSTKTIQGNYYNRNLRNDFNVNMSLMKKDFVTTLISPQLNAKVLNSISKDWYQYLYYYLYRQSEKNIPWASDIITALEQEYFLYENWFQSLFFYKEFQIKTEPVKLKQSEELVQSIIDANQNDPLSNVPMKSICSSKDYGGSFISTMSQSPALFPEDLQSQYMHSRSRVKEYIDEFCQHLQSKDHPVHIVGMAFCKAFSSYVNIEIEELHQLQDQHSNAYNETLFNKSLSITKQLQKFILKLQIIFKLFYCQTIDYQCFTEEKDELVTSVTSFLFQDESLYQSIYSLYELSEQSIMLNLSEKFAALRNIQQEDLKIDPKYCLNKSTLNYQKEFLKKKRDKNHEGLLPEDNELIKKIEVKMESDAYCVPSLNTNEFISYQLEIVDNGSKIPGELFINLENKEILIDKIGNDKSQTEIDLHIEKNINGNSNSRVNAKGTNNKLNRFKIEEENKVSGFKAALNMLESIKQYKTPFEKMVIITKIGEKIAESVNLFWKDLNSYLSPGYLTIDADNLLSIFLFILIKSKMSEIAIHSRIIKQFTTTTTKLSSIGYYYSTLDASVNYIDETDKNELINKMKGEVNGNERHE